ncbi:hypothetical protein PRIPAC_79711 [Pristionchus pacificus]|uniref:Serpentine receptor class gamma n=1 Tax=Pristionchus pacificus TaxID=54126 RepID=A0A2A6CKT6_PRIPA|nr:hypothetical protein PRIPAC_79711 [Pristionchus pacificus]|eukprot:PDM78663.1 G protein-coupled receptor [Pristionchus pacificus]
MFSPHIAETLDMLGIPPIVYRTFFVELIGFRRHRSSLNVLDHPPLQLPACSKRKRSTNLSWTNFQRKYDILLYNREISDLAKSFGCATQYQICENRMDQEEDQYLLIFCQYTAPLVPHFYFAIAPVNWIGDSYYGWDNTTGFIYRSITGTYYAIYAVAGIAMNIVAYRRLQKLSLISTTLYKQQRFLSLYTLASATCHMIFSTHQLIWSYSFLSGNSPMLATVRYAKPFVQDFTTFIDPIVLIIVSKQVRSAMRKDSPLPQRAKRVLTAISGSEEFSQEKRTINSDSYSLTPIPRASKDVDISIIIVLTEGTPLKNYETALNSIQCYTKLHSYPLHLISDAKYKECEKHNDENSWLLMLDADIAVINPNTYATSPNYRLIEKYIDPDYHITLFDRFFNFEVVAGSYLVKNSQLGRAFVQGFADYEFKLPNSIHGSDNGALHPYLVDLLVPENNRHLNTICASVWNESKVCARLIIGDRTRFPDHKLRILPKGKAWMRDLWLLRGRWADDDFMLHAIKEKTLRKSRPQIENISDRQVFQWRPYEKIQRHFPLLNKLNVTKCELGEERWVYDSRLKLSNEQKAKLLNYMESKILKRRLETIGKLARRL